MDAAAPKKEEEKPGKLVIQAPEPPARVSRIVRDEAPEIKVSPEEVKITKQPPKKPSFGTKPNLGAKPSFGLKKKVE